jgi:molybdopterin-guanine dinucleotide biosynthesis protein A
MERDKAFLPWEGRTLLEHQLGLLREVVEDAAIVVRTGTERFRAFKSRVIEDFAPGSGAPLYGLLAALEASKGAAFVLAVDLPLVPTALIRALSERLLDSDFEAVVPERSAGRLEPLCAAYRGSAAAVAHKAVAVRELSLHRFVRSIRSELWCEERWKGFSPGTDPFCNLNLPGEYEVACGKAPAG